VNNPSVAIELDPLDRKILRVLQTRGSTSHAELATQVGASQASCWRRIRALEEKGVLGDAVRLLNPTSVGRGMDVICQVRMRSHDKTARADFEDFSREHANIMECYSMSGEWDYLIRIVVRDVAEYERILMQEILTHPSVANSASHFALKCVKYTTALPV
jgi:DNA-binding Lrp family transcriptional regulator